MSITAMKQALEALNKNVGELRIAGARHILRTAIAEAEKQEPVGVVHHKPTSVPGADYEQVAVFTRALEPGTKLYTTPPAAQPAPVQEPVAFKIYKPTPPRHAITNVRDAELPWVYDQDPSSGNVASMWVTPVQALRSKK